MDLVDRHRPAQRVPLVALLDPGLVGPAVLAGERPAGGARRHLGPLRVGVGLGPRAPVRADELELVVLPGPDLGDEDLPDAGPCRPAQGAHRVQPPVPGVEVADHAHGLGVGGPDRERDPAHPVQREDVRAHAAPQLLVAALAREVQVDLAQRRQERVRVAQVDGEPVVVRDPQAVGVGGGSVLQRYLEEPRRGLDTLADDLVVDDDLHARGVGAVGAHDRGDVARAGAVVHAEDVVGVGVALLEDRVALLGGGVPVGRRGARGRGRGRHLKAPWCPAAAGSPRRGSRPSAGGWRARSRARRGPCPG